MRNSDFWKTDWFLSLIVSGVMLVAAGSDLTRSLARKSCDRELRACRQQTAAQQSEVDMQQKENTWSIR
jgi:hypothetical protein